MSYSLSRTYEGDQYTPAMMQFDGSTGYYSKTGITTSGNVATLICRFSRTTFSGDVIEYPVTMVGANYTRIGFLLVSDDYTTLANRRSKLQMSAQNSAGTNVCRLISVNTLLDGEVHTVFASFDGDTGVATLIIDGVDADDTGNADRIAPTTATLDSSASSTFAVGANHLGASFLEGDTGFVGYRDAYLTNWQDFIDSNGNPRQLDTIGWTQWNGGTFQTPMMTFDGSTGYYGNNAITSSGNKVVGIVRFKVAESTSLQTLFHYAGANYSRLFVMIRASNDATVERRNKILVLASNSAGSNVLNVVTNTSYADDVLHTAFISYDADAGSFTLIVDGASDINTGAAAHLISSGVTLQSGASSIFSVGSSSHTSLVNGISAGGQIGFVGIRDTYLTNWSDFMYTDGRPKALDTIGWTQWNNGAFQTPMMQHPAGNSAYYKTSVTQAGNTVTAVCRFRRDAWTGGSDTEYIMRVDGPSSRIRCGIIIFASDHTTADRRNKLAVLVQNNAGTAICYLFSLTDVMDGNDHTVFFSYDAGTADFIFKIDGADADDAGSSQRVTPITGTLETGSGNCIVGAANTTGTLYSNNGELGFI